MDRALQLVGYQRKEIPWDEAKHLPHPRTYGDWERRQLWNMNNAYATMKFRPLLLARQDTRGDYTRGKPKDWKKQRKQRGDEEELLDESARLAEKYGMLDCVCSKLANHAGFFVLPFPKRRLKSRLYGIEDESDEVLENDNCTGRRILCGRVMGDDGADWA